ncbi:hypothetical protein FQN54_000390 [Arachnomyces sp. PD_36]|nr:hypothetical protein FQN54_000390 [Arachnomyces sp. PD_36]
MSTSFSSLPIISLKALASTTSIDEDEDLKDLSKQLYSVFATTGFAYLTDLPLSFGHEDVFGLARKFFALPEEEKMGIAKRSFRRENGNTYRGYFPTQPLTASDNLKEGFEMGPPTPLTTPSQTSKSSKFNLSEPNVWPDEGTFPARKEMEKLYAELQDLASRLLSLLAVSLGKDEGFFTPYLEDSLSTLRLLHYPSRGEPPSDADKEKDAGTGEVKLSCTQHTDSGILTLLHQDPTGGLEVQDSTGKWVPAPYVPGSMVVNIGDLMAQVSGGRFVATMHRVRAPTGSAAAAAGAGDGFGRFSVPFFFEPGERCVVRSVDDAGDGEGVVYGDHVREKMKTWVEFRDEDEDE